MRTISPIQNRPRTQSMMKANSKRLFCVWVRCDLVITSLSVTHQNEMAPDIGRAVQVACVCAPEVSNVVSLQDEDCNPVDAGDDSIETKRCGPMTVLSPDCVAMMLVTVGGFVEVVVCTGDDNEEPGHYCENLVREKVGSGEFFSFCKRIVCTISFCTSLSTCHLQSEMAMLAN